MRFLKIVLSICLVFSLVYLAFYTVNSYQTAKLDESLSASVQSARGSLKNTEYLLPELTQEPVPETSETVSFLLPSKAPSDSPALENTVSSSPDTVIETPVCTQTAFFTQFASPVSTVSPAFSTDQTAKITESATETAVTSVTPSVQNTASASPAPSSAAPTAFTSEETPVNIITSSPEPALRITVNPSPVPTPVPESTVFTSPSPAVSASAAPVVSPSPIPEEIDALLQEYAALAEKNSDMAGWLYVEGTPIDYPVMFTPQQGEYYLHKNFEKKYSFAGLPFIDDRCILDPVSDNLIIYGHNMKNGSMFGKLKDYLKKDFFDAHPLIYFDTLKERGVYQIFAVIPVKLAEMDHERMRCYGITMTKDDSQVQMLYDYIDQYAEQKNPHAFPKTGDQVLTLSTCSGFRRANRLVVMALRIESDALLKPINP